MDIAPAVLRLKPQPDASQQQVIGHTGGPDAGHRRSGVGQDGQHPASGRSTCC